MKRNSLFSLTLSLLFSLLFSLWPSCWTNDFSHLTTRRKIREIHPFSFPHPQPPHNWGLVGLKKDFNHLTTRRKIKEEILTLSLSLANHRRTDFMFGGLWRHSRHGAWLDKRFQSSDNSEKDKRRETHPFPCPHPPYDHVRRAVETLQTDCSICSNTLHLPKKIVSTTHPGLLQGRNPTFVTGVKNFHMYITVDFLVMDMTLRLWTALPIPIGVSTRKDTDGQDGNYKYSQLSHDER